jgi:hypothetical protein
MGSTWTDVHPENIDPTNGTAALPTNFLRPIMGYGDINIFEFGSTSNYNSFQASASRRMRNGFLISFAYTFSKVLGSANSDTATVEPFLPPRTRNYGPLSYDRNHVASIRYFWMLPKPGKYFGIRPLGILTDGWELSGTGRFQTGGPFTPGFAQVNYIDITGSSQGARISVGDPNAPEELRYVRPTKGSWGNAGVNTARNPGINVWDTTASRTIRLHERLQLKLRVESYNTFNHTQFNAKSTTARFSGNDQIDPLFLTFSGSTNARRLQFAIQMNW